MNNNDEYIKMVLALDEEFFKEWKWKEGDMAISLRDNETKVMITEFDVWHDPRIIHIKILNDVGFTYLFSLDNLRPIPSQEQLQEMMKLSVTNFLDDFFEFCESVPNEKAYPVFKTNMNCFTLAYVMDRKFKKYWNGESWEKEE